MGSDALWKALEAAYPDLDDNSWRIQYALADWAKNECIVYGYKRAPASTGLETTQMSFSGADPHPGSPSYVLSQSHNPTPVAMTPNGSEGSRWGTLDFSGQAKAVHTRRSMKEEEKAHMRKIKSEGGACDECKEKKKKCDAEHIRERPALPKKRSAKKIATPKRGPVKEASAIATSPTGPYVNQALNPPLPPNLRTAEHEETTTQASSWSQISYPATANQNHTVLTAAEPSFSNLFPHDTFNENLSCDIFANTDFQDIPHVPAESSASNHFSPSTLNEDLRHAGPGFTNHYASPTGHHRMTRDSNGCRPPPPPG
ncbi:hypothetical protein H2201_007999 [Coniosporium apollinis]|uniref:Zn(2)-C6 fungal-type domain-containing protein n=2 Tax=Coniosporium TaxID=2810619 RepID=A0ABQ9NHB6_9PEZI|nr:hypothetical protein H2199_005732 [Cladosporium sp. JES 115]KAJ9657890.1 hypothetical protein H2201_007999 [Coniosporium apollinis]